MRAFDKLRLRLRSLFKGGDADSELNAEMQFHLDQLTEENIAKGMAPRNARESALRAIGGIAQFTEECRDTRRVAFVTNVMQDLRYAARTLRNAPAFTSVVVATLALGIGVTTAIFSLIDAVLLQSPPYSDPARLVRMWQHFPSLGDVALGTSPGEYLDYRDRNRAFASIAGFRDDTFDLTGDGEPVRVQAARVTHTLFSTLGVAPYAGRVFNADEDAPERPKVALLSYEFWQRHFGGDSKTVGSLIRLNEQPYTVCGIMPPGFEFPFTPASIGEPPSLWVPMAFTQDEIAARVREFPIQVVARLRDGISIEQAHQDVARVATGFHSERTDVYSATLRTEQTVYPLGSDSTSRAKPVLYTLAGAVAFVLLIACANVTNLLLARSAVREREIAIRKALGASAQRLVAQLLTESVLISLLGVALGCTLAYGIVNWVAWAWPSWAGGVARVGINGTALLFALAVCVLTGLLCGLAPAIHWTKPGGATALRQGRHAALHQSPALRGGLVVLESAAAVVLLIGAGLMIHTLVKVLNVPIGFSPDGVAVARTSLNRQRYASADRRRDAERQIEQRLAAIPGVTAVALTTHIPLADDRKIGFILEGETIDSVRWADNALVSGGYFAAMGIPILRGRTFDDRDKPGTDQTAIVNASMARRFWPNGDPIGKRIVWGGRHLTIVGVAGDVRISAIDAPVDFTIYTSVYQVESGATTRAVYVVRTAPERAAGIASAMRDAIWSVDRSLPVFDSTTMDRVVARSLDKRRFAAALLSSFAFLAVALAVIGIYGLLSYTVTLRTAEFGIRLALGATPAAVLRHVLAGGLRLAVLGVAIGLALGVGLARLIEGLLFGVEAFDTATFVAAPVLLLAVAALASFVPARRASRIEPMNALQRE